MKYIGLTGGIGTGKTLISTIFQNMGIPVFNSDRSAQFLMNSDEELKLKIKKVLGSKAYNANGEIDKVIIAKQIFNNPEKLASLNKIVHPVVASEFKIWTQNQNSAFVILEAAILFEAGFENIVDEVICVCAPKELRIKRVVQRDTLTEEQVYDRMRNQLPEEEKTKRANYIINNDENTLLLPQVVLIINKITLK